MGTPPPPVDVIGGMIPPIGFCVVGEGQSLAGFAAVVGGGIVECGSRSVISVGRVVTLDIPCAIASA
jgi:hypothetical protein